MNGECTSWVSRPFQAGVVADARSRHAQPLTDVGFAKYKYLVVNKMAGSNCCCRKGSQSPLAIGPVSRVCRIS